MLKHVKQIILICIGILIFVAYIKYNNGIPCFFYELTGYYCPGCGITRALLSLLHLDFYQAFRFNILVITLLPFFIIYSIYKYIFKGKKRIPNLVWSILLIFTLCFAVLRNIPAFDFLAPTII